MSHVSHVRKLNGKASARRPTDGPTVFLEPFLDAALSDDDPSGYSFTLLINWTLVDVMSGADTTTIALCVLRFLVKDPSRKEKLLQEIHSAELRSSYPGNEPRGSLTSTLLTRRLYDYVPQLNLVSNGRVPPAGLEMPAGYMLPAGINIIMNAWVVEPARHLWRQSRCLYPRKVATARQRKHRAAL